MSISFMYLKILSAETNSNLTLFRMGFFGAALGSGGAFWLPLFKIGQTYPTMMKLGTDIPYLRKIQKCINHVTHPLSSADI